MATPCTLLTTVQLCFAMRNTMLYKGGCAPEGYRRARAQIQNLHITHAVAIKKMHNIPAPKDDHIANEAIAAARASLPRSCFDSSDAPPTRNRIVRQSWLSRSCAALSAAVLEAFAHAFAMTHASRWHAMNATSGGSG
eukprot:6279605-Prymnesium_polylepis.1